MNRRQFLTASGVSAATIAGAAFVWSKYQRTGSSGVTVEPANALDNSIDVDLMAAVDAICDIVIPSTETLGAKAAGVPAWLLLATEHNLENTDGATLARFVKLLSPDQSFVALEDRQQVQVLTDVDNKTFNDRDNSEISALWQAIKTLIVTGYYTSEVGGEQELRYKLVPGRLLSSVDITAPDTDRRAWSSDWIAVKL